MKYSLITLLGIVVVFLTFGFQQQEREVTLFLVGDSTMADKPYTGSNPEKGWGQVLPLYFNSSISIDNHAVNGRSSKSFIDEGRWEAVMKMMRPGDYVIVQFGHNDQKENDPARFTRPEVEYRDNLEYFIKAAKEKGAHPILATSICRRKFVDNGELIDTHGPYIGVVNALGKSMGVPVLDLNHASRELLLQFGPERSKSLFLHYLPGDYEKFPKGVEDDTHLSPTGAFKVADLAINQIKKQVPELIKYLKE